MFVRALAGTILFVAQQGAPQPWWKPVWVAVRQFGVAFDTLFAGAVGIALGFLAKWAIETWTARAAARREFVQKFATKVTSRVATLANQHYWSLANYAGLLALLLEDYLHTRIYHLMLIWAAPDELAKRLDDLAQKTANQSFPHFCRLVGLFNAFQFQGSNTYLLTDHASGESCKRLYNTLVNSLSGELNRKLANLYQREIPYGSDGNQKATKISDLPAAALTDDITKTYLNEEKSAWRDWLRFDPAGVSRAAEALRAYNELLGHELALLYKDWFDRSRAAIGFGGDAVVHRWPNVLTAQSLVAIGQSRSESPLLRPLGTAVSTPAATAPNEGASGARRRGGGPAAGKGSGKKERPLKKGQQRAANPPPDPRYFAEIMKELLATQGGTKPRRSSGEAAVRK
jgi:hypothetical protein